MKKLIEALANRRWSVGLGLILLIGAIARFSNFRFGLPYFDQFDEPEFFYEAAFQRGLIPSWLHPNPSPALIALYKLAQMLAEAITHQSALMHVADIVSGMRFVSVILSVLTIGLIGLCARQLAGNKAGWLAAATWTVIPLVIYHSFIAIDEPWMMLFGALCLYAAAATLLRGGIGWPLVSVWAGLIGFAFKYSMFPFAGIGLAAVLFRWWANPAERRIWLRAAVLQVVSIGGVLAFLILFGGLSRDVGSPSREVAVFFNNPLARLTDLKYASSIIAVGFWQIGLPPIVFAVLSAAALLIVSRQGKALHNPRFIALLMYLLLGLFCAFLVPAYLGTTLTTARYFFAADLVLVIVAACCAAIAYDWLITAVFANTHHESTVRVLLTSVAVLLLLIVWLGPLAAQSTSDTLARLKPYTLTDMTIWASYTLDEGGILTEGLGHRAFSREFGGYTGLLRDWTFYGDLQSYSPADWQSQGYRYAELVQDHVREMQQTAAGRVYLNSMLELRRFPAQGNAGSWAGPAFVVYQLHGPAETFDFTFDNTFRLIGADGLQQLVAPGDIFHLTFYWQAMHKPADNYVVFVHLRPMRSDQVIAQADGAPGPIGRPTITWDVPTETLVSSSFALKIPPGLAPGQYRIVAGLYDQASGRRLPTAQGDSVLLATLSVTTTIPAF